MPEMKRNFTRGKMNKDRDERLVPQGEYRDAMNIQVTTSEESNVGTIQNVLGNTLGCTYADNNDNPIPAGATTVGSVSDEKNDTLYWLVAGPSDINSILPLAENDTHDFKDIIMRTNPLNNTGCEPVFVDKYGWCVGINDGSLGVNSITFTGNEEFYSNITPGMNVTGYTGSAATQGPILVNNVGSISSLSPINYFQGSDTQVTPPITSTGVDIMLRTFEDPNNPGEFSMLNDHGVQNGAASTPGLDANDQVQTNIFQLVISGFLPPEFQVGATIDTPAGGLLFAGAEIIDVVFDWTCPVGTDVGTNQNTCVLTHIITVDTTNCTFIDLNYPAPSVAPFGPPNWDSEIVAYGLLTGSTATFDPADLQIPNNTIHILPSSDQWLDEIYNILYDNGVWTGAYLEIQGSAGVNFPQNTCIDHTSVSSPVDDFFEIIGCPWAPVNANVSVDALNMNPQSRPITLVTLPANGLEAIFLNDDIDLQGLDTLCFTSERVLEFNPNNLITGINVVDDMLFWTDNFTEPKKINIPRSVEGTDVMGNTHTAIINNATGLTLASNTPIRREHVTVIRKSPKNALNLELISGRDPSLTYTGITWTAVDPILNTNINASSIIASSNPTVSFDFSTLQVGDKVQIVIETDINNNDDFSLAWDVGSFLLLKEFDIDDNGNGIPPPTPLSEHTIRAVITDWQWTSFDSVLADQDPAISYGSQWNGGQSPTSADGTAHVEIEIVSLKGIPPQVDPNNAVDPINLKYVVDLELKDKPIFEDKFPRFSYRYKYSDGEYSAFAPWSEVAFLPSHFNYESKKGWNTGMINHTISIKSKGFLQGPVGLDVIEVDILYKEEGSPNVYVVETISPLDISPQGMNNAWGLDEYVIDSETIKNVLPSNQLLRPWDNVPKKALAQEVTGNRIVYANYEQNFDLIVSGQKYKPEFKNYLSNWGDVSDGQVEKSIKSLRDYKLGVVFTDEYGRETPILISRSGGFKVEKVDSKNANRLVAGLNGEAPGNMAYFKFFIKETSTEYYNLPMDRWYAAEDGNIWLAFPSTDRNKVDADTSLYFKKGDGAIENTTKYKILAIENEAPEFIKTRRIPIGSVNHNVAGSNRLFGNGTGANELTSAPRVDGVSFTLQYAAGFQGSSISKMEDIIEDIYVQFTSGNDYSQQYKVSEITSDRDAQNQLAADGTGSVVPPTEYYISIEGNLKNDIDFIFDNAANPSLVKDGVSVKFTKAVVENKPIYAGRFFAKIENDGKIKNQITDDSIGVNYVVKASKDIYLLENDEDLKTRSAQAALVDLYHAPTSPSNYTNFNAIINSNAYAFDVHPDFAAGAGGLDGDQNIDGQNINNWFARSAYFNILPPVGYTAIQRFADYAGYSSEGVWFIDRSTGKHTLYAGNDGDATDLAWPDDNAMNHTSPAYDVGNTDVRNNPAAAGWTTTSNVGSGISHGSNYSSMMLSFGGLGFSKTVGPGEIDMQSLSNGENGWYGVFENFFSVGEEGIGNYGDAETVNFVNRINSGFMFKWENDPTDTVYTFVNQRHITNHMRFSRHDFPVTWPYSLYHRKDLLESYATYHRSWRSQLQPSMANWDPAGPIGNYMTNGLELRDIELVSHDIFSSSGTSEDVNYVIVKSTKSKCYNGNSDFNAVNPETYGLHKGMMLAAYDVTAVNTPGVAATGAIEPANKNIIIKDVGNFDQNLDGGNGGYKITLTGYSKPLHWDHATSPETGNLNDGRFLIFRQVTMNGVSNFTEDNTDQYKQFWHDETENNGSGGIGAVGYKMLMVEPIDEYSDGGNLPPDPYVWETKPKDNTGLDIYYEISENNPIELNTQTITSAIPQFSKVENTSGLGAVWNNVTVSNNIYPNGVTIKISELVWIGPGSGTMNDGTVIQPIGVNDTLKITKPNGVSFEVQIAQAIPNSGNPQTSNTFVLKPSLYNSNYHLNWHNCYTFGNGVESNRIKDNFNLPYIANGIKASTTLEHEYKQERRKHGLIYSGIYNSTSGVNNLNQFIAAEKITKDINPVYGSIQKLKAGWGQGGDLIALCEDRVLRILANKDALYNADGNTNITSTNRVLGTATPYTGEYGISKNPESFASESYRAYFTDKVRGTVMRLSNDGLTPISDHGMKDWFRDHLKLSNKLTGSYDDKKDEYNITINDISKTVTFKEDVRGWVSFKSFVTNNGVSCANEYYTFKNGNLWKHNHDVPGNRNTFYGNYVNSTFDVIFNDAPGSVKSFQTINYEGSSSKVTQRNDDEQYYNNFAWQTKQGWYVDSITTNKESGDIYEFIEKEGKWFNYIRGKEIVVGGADDGIIMNTDGSSSFRQASFAIQGLGITGGVSAIGVISGCTDATANNYDPTANDDDGSCTYDIVIEGCMESTADNYDATATADDGSCFWQGCTNPTGNAINPTTFPNEAYTYNNGGNIINVGCIEAVPGCTDATAFNYDATANVSDGSCYPVIEGCLGTPGGGVLAENATNFNNGNGQLSGVLESDVNTDNGSCFWSWCADSNDQNYNAALVADILAESNGYPFDANAGGGTDTTSACFTILGCMDGDATEYGLGGFGTPGDGFEANNYAGPNNTINFNPPANTDDGSCLYTTSCYWCDMTNGQVQSSSSTNNVTPDTCDNNTVTAAFAQLNYVGDAWFGLNPGEPCISGCMDSTAGDNPDINGFCADGVTNVGYPNNGGCPGAGYYASNHDPSATWDSMDQGGPFFSCVYPGCTDPLATNYDANATVDDGSCTLITGCTCNGTNLNGAGVVNDCFGAGIPAENYDPNAVSGDNGGDDSCTWASQCYLCSPGDHYVNVTSISGNSQPGWCDANGPWKSENYANNNYVYPNGIFPAQWQSAAQDAPCRNGCMDGNAAGIVDPATGLAQATNYDPNATWDSDLWPNAHSFPNNTGQCSYVGCIDPNATNYWSHADSLYGTACANCCDGCMDQSANNYCSQCVTDLSNACVGGGGPGGA